MQHRCHSILIFFQTKTEQEGVLAHKKWRETKSGLHLTAVGCSARSLRGNAKKESIREDLRATAYAVDCRSDQSSLPKALLYS